MLTPAFEIQIFRNFTRVELPSLQSFNGVQNVHGGPLLALTNAHDGLVWFVEWETGSLVRKMELPESNAIKVIWSENGTVLLIATTHQAFVLRFDQDAYSNAFNNGEVEEDDGVEVAFELVDEINMEYSFAYMCLFRIVSAKWVADCLLFTTANNRLNYWVGNHVNTAAHFDLYHFVLDSIIRPVYLISYMPNINRVFVIDKVWKLFTL